MKQAVHDAFLAFTVKLEGEVLWFYPDVKGYVSIGDGDLMENTATNQPTEEALALPMVHPDGTPATRAEIAAEWRVAKTYPDAPRLGHLALEHVCKLRLTQAGLERLVFGKLMSNDGYLRAVFPYFDDWPLDAQLATHSMSWACGAAFQPEWPKLTAALRARDWLTASVECFMPEEKKISGLKPRNVDDRILYRNAQLAPDASVLYWPRDLKKEQDADEPPTDPAAIVHPDVPMYPLDKDDGD